MKVKALSQTSKPLKYFTPAQCSWKSDRLYWNKIKRCGSWSCAEVLVLEWLITLGNVMQCIVLLHCILICNVLNCILMYCYMPSQIKWAGQQWKVGGNPGVPYCWKSNWKIGWNFGNLTKMKSQTNNFGEISLTATMIVTLLILKRKNLIKCWHDSSELRHCFSEICRNISIVQNFCSLYFYCWEFPEKLNLSNPPPEHSSTVCYGSLWHCNTWFGFKLHCTLISTVCGVLE